MPATSLNVTLVCAPSIRRARERPNEPSAFICPPAARREIHTKRATSRITGPKPRIRLSRNPRPSLIGLASIVTLWSCERLRQRVVVGERRDLRSRSSWPPWRPSSVGYLNSFLNSPLTASPGRRDLGDVVGLDLAEERRAVRDRHRLLAAGSEDRDADVVEDQQDGDEDPEPPADGPPEALRLCCCRRAAAVDARADVRGEPRRPSLIVAASYSQPGTTKISQATGGAIRTMLMPHCMSRLNT